MEENTQLVPAESQIDFQALQTTIDNGQIDDYEVIDAYGAYATGNNVSTAVNTIYNFAKAHPELGLLVKKTATKTVQHFSNKQISPQVEPKVIEPVTPVEPVQVEDSKPTPEPELEMPDVSGMVLDTWINSAKSQGIDPKIITEVKESGKAFPDYYAFIEECNNVSNKFEAERKALRNIQSNKRSAAIDAAGGLQSYVKQLLYTHYGTTCLSAATLDFELNKHLSYETKAAYPNGLLYWAVENIPDDKLPDSPDAFLSNLKVNSNTIDAIMQRCYESWNNNEYVNSTIMEMCKRAQSEGIYRDCTLEEALSNFASNYEDSNVGRRCDYNAPFMYLVWCGLKGLQSFQTTQEEDELVLNVLNTNPDVLRKYADTYSQKMDQGIPEQVGAYAATQEAMNEAERIGFITAAGQFVGKAVQAPFTAADNFSDAMASVSPHYAQSREERRMLQEERRAHRRTERLNAEDIRHEQALYGQQQAYQQQYDPRMQQGTRPPQQPGFFDRFHRQPQYNQPMYNSMYNQPVYNNPYDQQFQPYGMDMQPISTKIILVLIHLLIAIIFFVINKKKGIFMIIGAIIAIIGWVNNNGSMRNRPPQYNMQGQQYPDGETGTINPIAFIVCGYIIMAIALFIH